MGRVGAVLNSDLTYIPLELLPGIGGGTLPALNSSGATVVAGDCGYLDSSGAFKTTTTALLAIGWAVVQTGGANGAQIIVAVRGTLITVNYTGTAPNAGEFLTLSGTVKLAQRSTVMRPEVFAVATANGSGGTVVCTLLTVRLVVNVAPAYVVWRSDSHGVSDFVSTLAANSTTYNSGSGTYTPTFTGNLLVQCWAAGGGGKGSGAGPTSGDGGGGGAYSESTIAVTNGVGIAYSVGAGGIGGVGPGTAGGNGGDSTFGVTTVVAKGGNGSTGAGGLASAGTGTTKFSGGNGTNAAGGGGGSSAGTAANGNNGSGGTGGTAPTGGGAGGNGGAVAVAGTAPGGGGGGGNVSNGAAGANGRITVSQLTYGTSIPYSTVTSGNEAAIKPLANTQYGKLVLHNSTRSNEALIDSVDTTTDIITITATAPANWAAGDSITVRSTVNTDVLSSAYFMEIDLSSSANTLIPANAVGIEGEILLTDIGVVGTKMQVHPYLAYTEAQVTGTVVQNISAEVSGTYCTQLINRRFCIRNTAFSATSVTTGLKISKMILAVP